MSGKHARHRPRWFYMVMGVVSAMALAFLGFLSPTGAAAADTFPSQDACHTTNNATPAGNCGPFHQLYRDSFNPGGVVAAVPLGKFSSCGGDGDFKCAGLKASYPHYYATLGAYPNGWPDTAGNPNEHRGRTIGGNYDPPTTVSVLKSSTGDGIMRVHMWHEGAGTAAEPAGVNHVAAPVPLKCMGLRYGKFTERFRLSARTPGYKLAHLRYTPNEVDYPEAGGNFSGDPISEFTHGFAESGADAAPNSAWTQYHTYSTELVPGHIRFYFDGKLFRTVNADFPDKADWILQNESALAGAYAAKGSSVDVDTSWLTCYSYAP